MLKLIIADDERIIRETISTIINWKQYDIELVGLCKMVWKPMIQSWMKRRILY